MSRRLHWPDIVVVFHFLLNDGGQAKVEEVKDIFIDGVWRGWRESTNENKSIFKENTGRRHLGDKGANGWPIERRQSAAIISETESRSLVVYKSESAMKADAPV